MLKSFSVLCALLAIPSRFGAAQAVVRVEPANLQGPRTLQDQTGIAAIRDYLQSWQSFKTAFETNRADMLDPAFVGTARDKLTETIHQQAALGIHTRYQDLAHDLQIVFYSPEGLSIELTDKIEYDVGIVDRDTVKTTQRMHARFMVVLTPAEARWRVRVFQSMPE